VDALKKEIVTLSTAHRVLSPYTALLVLETEWDYSRLGIDHTSLTDILAVKGSRVALAHRSDAVAPPQGGPQDGRKAAAEKAAQFGMIGLTSASATATADPSAPTAPWGVEREARDEAPALHDLSRAAPAQARARGETSGDGIGEAFGAAGLGLSGVGRGAGGAGALRAAPSPLARPEPQEAAAAPYAGRFAEVMSALEKHDAKSALAGAQEWHASAPGDVMSLVALGEALEASNDLATAARAYGSIIDLYPSRADLRRMAGERLERVRDSAALDLALDTYSKALEQRPDHPSSHRMLAFALLRKGEHARAFEAALAGLAFRYPSGRFAGVEQVLREDLGLIGAAWARAEPDMRAAISARVRAAGGTIEDAPSLRFVLSWETDANDVDLHVRDASGETAFYSHPTLSSGGSLVADVTTGYGPECFTVRLPKGKRSTKYTVRAHYYARGPMGYGMGKLEVVEHDGHGGLSFEERPFVVMNDHAFVELGAY
jgi:tetratricopeptide (TPR) repeat protein